MALTPWELLAVALAVYRATVLVTRDTIGDTPRDWVAEHLPGRAADLVGCGFCASWWLALIAYVAACVALGRVGDVPVLAHMIECWAVMGASALLVAVDARLAE